tara:strand:+ start:70 stop:720 length:651 start_codon:yes stop_codon:yes gene_type:complete
MEYETYGDVIDAYESGVGVEGGESLTDYIKRNNIKIKEIEMDPIGDFEKILKGSRPMEKEGIMQMASYEPGNYDPAMIEEYEQYKFEMNEQRPGMPIMEIDEFIRMQMGEDRMTRRIDPPIEEVVREFIRVKGRKPNSLEELKEFFEMRMGTAQKPEMKMIADLVEEDKSRITLADGSFPDLSGDGQITKKDILIGRGVIDRDDKQSGGLAAILGV